MAKSWYYVLEGERQGPIELIELKGLIDNSVIGAEDYVWTKGYENWLKVQDVDDLKDKEYEEPSSDIPQVIAEELHFDLSSQDRDLKNLYIKVGADRGGQEVEYGPFSINILVKLYDEKRVNGKTFVFSKGLKSWTLLAELKGFESLFNELPPVIEEKDKRAFKRKPLIARMFIQNNNHVFEGICRDLSIGGMQVLVDNFPTSEGDKITINVHPESEDYHFTAAGEVVRNLDGGQGFSFRFIELNKDAINAINSYIG